MLRVGVIAPSALASATDRYSQVIVVLGRILQMIPSDLLTYLRRV